MTMKLSPTQIKEIAERAEKATPGPWLIGTHQILDADGKHVLWAAKPNNRDFTAHARQDIPALLAHIAAQDEESRRFYRADGTFETLATAEEVVAKRKEAAAKIAKLERERDEATVAAIAAERREAELLTLVEGAVELFKKLKPHKDTELPGPGPKIKVGQLTGWLDAAISFLGRHEKGLDNGSPEALEFGEKVFRELVDGRARIAQLESQIAVKDGALRVIANGEIVLPGGTPVEIAREALKGSA